jgi:KaiC/GvpD/RAD55 family RecA-like ATPase
MAGPQVKSDVQALVRVFEALLSAYLGRAMRGQANQKPFLDKLADLRNQHPALGDLAVDKISWQVKLNLKVPVPADDLLDWLAETTDGLVDVSLIEFGNLGALREASAVARDVLSRFGDEPARLGVPYSILSGSLVRRRPLGAEGLDNLLDDGIPDGHQLLLVSPPVSERSALVSAILAKEIRSGGKALDMLVARSPVEYAEWLGASGVDVSSAMRSQRLALLDWRATPERKASAVEMTEGLCRVPQEPVHLESAVAAAISYLSRGPGRAFIDLGEVIQRAGVDSTVNMLKGLFRRLRRAGMTTVYYVDEAEVGADIIAGLAGRFDGLLRVRERGAQGTSKTERGAKRWEIGFETMVGASFNPEFRPVAEIDGSLVVGAHSFAPVASPGGDGEGESDLVDLVLGGGEGGASVEPAPRAGPSFGDIVELWKLAGYNVRRLEAAREAPAEEREEAQRHFERDAQRLYALKERFLKSGAKMDPREKIAFLKNFTDPERMGEIESRLSLMGVAAHPAPSPPAAAPAKSHASAPAAKEAESPIKAAESPAAEPAPPMTTPEPPRPEPVPAPQPAAPHLEVKPPAPAPAPAAPAEAMPEPSKRKSLLDRLGSAFGAPAKAAPASAPEPQKKAAGPDLKSMFSPKPAKPDAAGPAPAPAAEVAPTAVPKAEPAPTEAPPAPAAPKPAKPMDDKFSAAFGVEFKPDSAATKPKPSPTAESTAATPLTDRVASLFKSTIVSTKRERAEGEEERAAAQSLYLRSKPATTQARSSPIVRDESKAARPAPDAKKTLVLESALERVFGVKIKPAPPPPTAEPGKPLKSCRVCEFELPFDEDPCRYCGTRQK